MIGLDLDRPPSDHRHLRYHDAVIGHQELERVAASPVALEGVSTPTIRVSGVRARLEGVLDDQTRLLHGRA
jgi:hypothetical protein